jgi:hypothetical protein
MDAGRGLTTTSPTEQEIRNYFHALSDCGRWGDHDRLGTLNFISSEKRTAAAAVVRDGDMVSLSRDMDPADRNPARPASSAAALYGIRRGAVRAGVTSSATNPIAMF